MMAYQLTWQIADRAILITAHDEFSLSDFGALTNELVTGYLKVENAPVHLLLDLSIMEKFPHQLGKIRTVTRDLFQHPALGKIVLVGRVNPLAGCIIDTLARTFRVECLSAASAEDAIRLIEVPALN